MNRQKKNGRWLSPWRYSDPIYSNPKKLGKNDDNLTNMMEFGL